MFIQKSKRRVRWISYLLILQVIALIVPARPISAADIPVVIPKETVDAMVFQVIWQKAMLEAEREGGRVAAASNGRETSDDRPRPRLRMETMIYQEFIHVGAASIILETEVWPKYLQKITPGMGDDFEARRNKSYEQQMFAFLDAAAEIPELRPYVRKVWENFSKVRLGPRNGEYFLRNTHILMATQSYGKARSALLRAPQVMQQVFEAAQHNPEVAAVFDTLFGEELGVSIEDFDGGEYVATHPGEGIPDEWDDGMQHDGTMEISPNDLQDLIMYQFSEMYGTIGELRETLKVIDGKQNEIVDYINNQQEREAMEALARAKAAEYQLKIDAIQSSLFIAYTIADVIDPEFAYQLSVVGNSTLQVAQSLKGWMEGMAAMGGLTQAGALSTVVMTGNVLGAVMNVVSLFGGSQPTPEQMILEQIGLLREQVNELRTEMHGRFDRIDAELNAIYSTMQDRFNLIDIQLGKLNGKVDEVQKSLVGLDLKLSRLERNNFEFLDALGRRPLLEAINGGLGYEDRTGEEMPYQPDFVAFENTLHGWATIHAFDPLAAGPTQRDYSPGEVLDELGAYPLDSNINYLNGWLAANGVPGIADERLASPRDWIFANRAYTEMAFEWPEHIQRINPQRQADIDAVGEELEAAMQRISTLTTVTGTVGNTLLFDKVFDYYTEKYDQLDIWLAAHEANYVAEVRRALERVEEFNLYGGVNQALTYETPEVTTLTCGDAEGHGSFAAPAGLAAKIPNFNLYNLAEYLNLGNISTCLSDEYLDQYEHCVVDNEPPFSVDCHMRGTHKARLTVYFNNEPIMRQSILGGDEAVGGRVKFEWEITNRYKDLFAALPGPDAATPAEAAQLAAFHAETVGVVEGWLVAQQKELYRRIGQELSSASLRPYAIELAGAKKLLDSFVSLGFQRALAEDELLHAMLYGNQQVLDDVHIATSYLISKTQPITGTGILVNPRLVLREMSDERTEAFHDQINLYLDAITSQEHTEVADYAVNARKELAFTMMVMEEVPPATPEPPTEEPPTQEPPVTPEPPTEEPPTEEPPTEEPPTGVPVTPVPPVTPRPPDVPSDDHRRMHLPMITR